MTGVQGHDLDYYFYSLSKYHTALMANILLVQILILMFSASKYDECECWRQGGGGGGGGGGDQTDVKGYHLITVLESWI